MAGPDAQDFLHRLSTANIKQLQPGHGTRSCFLSGTGKIRSYHTIWCLGPEVYEIEFSPGENHHWKKELLAMVEELTFAEKFKLSENAEGSLILFGPGAGARAGFTENGSFQTKGISDGLRAFHHGSVDLGTESVRVYGNAGKLAQWVKDSGLQGATAEELEALRVAQVRPLIDVEITSESNPLELGLIESLPRGKGCYPGQEVIERTISIGAPAKRLVLIEGQGRGPSPGDSISAHGGLSAAIGSVTSVVSDGRQYLALALVRKSHSIEGVDVGFFKSSADESFSSGRIKKLSPLPS